MRIKSNAPFGFSLMALLSAASVQPASAFTEVCAGPPVPGVTGPITNGSSCPIDAPRAQISVLYIGAEAADFDTLTLPSFTLPIFVNQITTRGENLLLTVPLGELAFSLNNLNSGLPGILSFVSATGYANSTFPTSDGLGFSPVYHFADFGFSSEDDYNSVFGSTVPLTPFVINRIDNGGGFSKWLFLGAEDLPWAEGDDWNDLVFAMQGIVIGTFSAPVVPEPSTWTMMLVGFAGMGLVAHRAAKGRRSTPG